MAKKLFLLVLVLVPMLLAACGDSNGDTTATPTATPAAAPNLVDLLKAVGTAEEEFSYDPGQVVCLAEKGNCRLSGMVCDLVKIAACQEHGRIPADFMPLGEYLPEQ